MKLKSKIIGIPTALIIFVFIVMGFVIYYIFNSYSEHTLNDESDNMIKSATKQLNIGLSLVSSSSTGRYSYMALESGDFGLADELVAEIKGMGLDAVYMTNLDGKLVYG